MIIFIFSGSSCTPLRKLSSPLANATLSCFVLTRFWLTGSFSLSESSVSRLLLLFESSQFSSGLASSTAACDWWQSRLAQWSEAVCSVGEVQRGIKRVEMEVLLLQEVADSLAEQIRPLKHVHKMPLAYEGRSLGRHLWISCWTSENFGGRRLSFIVFSLPKKCFCWGQVTPFCALSDAAPL